MILLTLIGGDAMYFAKYFARPFAFSGASPLLTFATNPFVYLP
jgi:hypothetical protein